LILDTRHLFLRLLRTFEVDTVCDVGSMDGTDALRFRRALPAAEIIALEPNPRNFDAMSADARLRDQRIRALPLAASDVDSDAQFFVVGADSALANPAFRGMSSLYRRSDGSPLAEVVRVRTVRLDSLLGGGGGAGAARIALWIDAEGMAFETIAGASGVLGRTRLLHVEVETEPCIGAAQRLLPDVERFLTEAGFVLLATDEPRTSRQLNALFVPAALARTKSAEIRWHIASRQLERRVRRAVVPFLPTRLRRFLSRRANAARA
jgi:FkbM family methyltransferase